MIFRTFQSRISHHVLATLAVCALSSPALAQVSFEPVGQWQVGPTQLANMRGLSNVKLPCVITNEFDNGFIVRFSGGDEQIMAMAIDFRQDIFREGRKYTAMLSLGDNYAKQVSGSAFTPNTMIFNLRALKDFYGAAKQATEMELSIAGNAMRFSLGRFGSSLSALEQCYAANETAPSEPEIAAAPMPQSYDDIIENTAPAEATGSPMNIAQVTPRAPAIAQWNASGGEDIRTVLNRWADRAGYDLQWQAEQNGTVAQDMALDGSFEEAVSQLLATSGAASGISGHIDQTQVSSGPAPVDPGPMSTNWNAPAGASLQSVLDRWAAQAGITVIWNASINAPVKQNLTMSGPFEAAVQVLLDQYMDDSVRPVGALNTDPQTGARTLTIDMDRAG